MHHSRARRTKTIHQQPQQAQQARRTYRSQRVRFLAPVASVGTETGSHPPVRMLTPAVFATSLGGLCDGIRVEMLVTYPAAAELRLFLDGVRRLVVVGAHVFLSGFVALPIRATPEVASAMTGIWHAMYRRMSPRAPLAVSGFDALSAAAVLPVFL